MRTTVTLPDHLLLEAKKLAAERRVPLTRVIEESVRSYLAQARAPTGSGARIESLPVVPRARPMPGLDLDDTSALWELE